MAQTFGLRQPSIVDARGAWPSGRGRRAGTGARAKSFVHQASLALVWLAIATSGIVFSEPAPVDALTMGLIVLLPVIGLVAISEGLLTYLSLWLAAAAGGLVASVFAADMRDATVFTVISLYLYLASFVFGAFVAKRPQEHTRLILNAWTVAAGVAAVSGLIGYFSLLPGAYELFTKFGRAAGTFKDPNVFGPFMVAPLLYLLHLVLTRPLRGAVLPLLLAGLLVLATLLSFSRGAWINLALGVLVYGYLAFVTAPTTRQRERIVALLALGLVMFAGLITVAVQFEPVSKLLAERATLQQSYDVGPQGRFAGQAKALGLAAENPLGIGAHTFTSVHHQEDVHNVYVSVFLNSGWLGGSAYCLLVLLTIGIGFLHLLKASPVRPLFIVLYAAFCSTAFEGLVIDTDHWRHFYLLMGLIWGLMSVPRGVLVGNAERPRRYG
ncbi:MAG: O-antigen ligase family protein [Alphaproteobacteria bacterium]|nr:O-antigen ligase family protein [Alphaproteobacteria bacterium]